MPLPSSTSSCMYTAQGSLHCGGSDDKKPQQSPPLGHNQRNQRNVEYFQELPKTAVDPALQQRTSVLAQKLQRELDKYKTTN